MGNKQRFYSLGKGTGLAVALQSNIPEGEEPDGYLKEGADRSRIIVNRKKGQIFHPAVFWGEDEEGFLYEVWFPLVTNGQERFSWLVFRAKQWTRAGRFGETEAFGFDATNPREPGYKGIDYILLAFPGITGQFTETFFRVHQRGTNFPCYIKVSARSAQFLGSGKEESEDAVVVSMQKVSARQAPDHLLENF